MSHFKPHYLIPGLRKPFVQRNEARAQRDRAVEERDHAILLAEAAERNLCEAQEQIKALTGTGRQTGDAASALFVPPGHFYSPIVDPREADAHISRQEALPTPTELPGIRIDAGAMAERWRQLLPFLQTHPFPAEKTAGLRYAFVNDAFSWADGLVLHAMLRLHQPKRIVEIGSGWSSACTVDTVERYFKTACEISFIEPYPELLKTLLGDTSLDCTIFPTKVQEAPLGLFETLGENDVLFIDSTHIMRTGSDVCHELFEILPRLRPGVIVHFHDIFWPFEYPRHWAVSENRSWNELYAIRAFLTENDRWRLLFFNHYFALTHAETIQATFPDFLKNSGG